MFAVLITLPHLSFSALMKARNSSGVLLSGWRRQAIGEELLRAL